MKWPWIVAASLLMCVLVVEIAQCAEKNPKLYNIVLIGATGDLAQKYLWKALFNLFQDQYQKEKVGFDSVRKMACLFVKSLCRKE